MLYSNPEIRTRECTIGESVHCTGSGLHSGRQVSMTLLPAPPGSGVNFLRRDVDIERALVNATWSNVVDTGSCLVLANRHGITVTMPELLLAALRGCGVDNVLIDLSQGEVPIVDGTCATLMAMIDRSGVVAQDLVRHGIWIDEFIAVRFGEHYACLKPAAMPSITLDIVPTGEFHGVRQLSLMLQDSVFEHDIAPVSIFDIDPEFYPDGPGAGILNTTTGCGRPASRPGAERNRQRKIDEFARYKAVECLGTLALAEAPVFGELYAYKSGHFINHALLEALFSCPSAWRRLSYPEIDELTGGSVNTSGQRRADASRRKTDGF